MTFSDLSNNNNNREIVAHPPCRAMIQHFSGALIETALVMVRLVLLFRNFIMFFDTLEYEWIIFNLQNSEAIKDGHLNGNRFMVHPTTEAAAKITPADRLL
jgi:hypothetical protein